MTDIHDYKSLVVACDRLSLALTILSDVSAHLSLDDGDRVECRRLWCELEALHIGICKQAKEMEKKIMGGEQ